MTRFVTLQNHQPVELVPLQSLAAKCGDVLYVSQPYEDDQFWPPVGWGRVEGDLFIPVRTGVHHWTRWDPRLTLARRLQPGEALTVTHVAEAGDA